MAGFSIIWSRGAAGPGEATKEIDFVPHILPCSSWLALDALAQHHVRAGGEYTFLHLLVLTVSLFGSNKHGSKASENSGKKKTDPF